MAGYSFKSLVRRAIRSRNSYDIEPLQYRAGYDTVFDDESMAVLHIPGRVDECIVSFTGVGHALGGIDLQSPEFARSGGDETRVFVIDKRRTWGNGLDWQNLGSIMADLAPRAEITTLGNSMGGFLAVLAVPVLGAVRAISFAPQWSIHPAIVPDESRWQNYRQAIDEIRYPDLSDAVKSPARFFVFFGNGEDDKAHLDLFQKGGVEPFVVKGCKHDVASHLKNTGLLYPIIAACRGGGDVGGLLKGALVR